MKTVFVGAGQGCKAVLELVVQHRLASLSPQILGVVDLRHDAPGLVFARSQGWPTFTRLAQALQLPGLELVIELTGVDHVRDQIYHQVPQHVRVMDHSLARVFWDLDEAVQHLRDELQEKTRLEAEIRTDRRRLQEILDSLPDAVMVVDDQERIERVNRRFESVTGIDAGQVLGQLCSEQICRRPCGDAPDVVCPRLAVIGTGKPTTVIQQRSCLGRSQREGEAFYEVTANPIHDGEGRVSVVVTSREVTDQILLQRELQQSEKHAAVGKLAAGVAHEINNPLTGILTFAEELLDGTSPEDPEHDDLQLILRETLRCRQIVRDLLDFSRQTAPRREVTAIRPIVQKALDLVRNQASFHDIEFEIELGVDAALVEVDPNQLQQVVLNLIINARDAMSGKGEVFVHAHPDGGRVVIEVGDHGCGIPPDLMARIFEPFFSTKGEQGMGLGLAVVRSIIEQHGGQIDVQSSVGQGATFSISLPRARTPPRSPRVEGDG